MREKSEKEREREKETDGKKGRDEVKKKRASEPINHRWAVRRKRRRA